MIRVLIVADDPLARSALALLLRNSSFEIVEQVPTKEDLPLLIDTLRPAVILWDLGNDGRSGLERISTLNDRDDCVIALVPNETTAAQLQSVTVRGVLFRDSAAPILEAAITAASAGLWTTEPSIAQVLVRQRDRTPSTTGEELTARELEVLGLLSAGLANKLIASRLSITEHTVKFHVNAILTKLGAQSRTDAVVRAARLGLITL